MADIKTNLRELSVATTIGLLKLKTQFTLRDLYDPKTFISYAQKVISGNISNANNISTLDNFTSELKQIIDNGFYLGKTIYENNYFKINKNSIITWEGNDLKKKSPVDITIDKYGFSLKENSFILENMGLYKLLNCYTGSNYKSRHIFKDYAKSEYEHWFNITWQELIQYLKLNNRNWKYHNISKKKLSTITMYIDTIKLDFFKNDILVATSTLPTNCDLTTFEKNTCSKIRENVFSKYINLILKKNENYNFAKKNCAIVATNAVVKELNENLNYTNTLPKFLRIYKNDYYYAKTTSSKIEIYKVPSIEYFHNNIFIESIEALIPKNQANILTTIKNKKNGETLVLRNECRFSHGQFNGTPEAKMYYENNGSLEIIYEKI